MTKSIPVERLTEGTLLYLPELHNRGMICRCDDFGTVESIKDDGEGFLLTLEFSVGHFDTHYVPYGGEVEYGGRGEPRLVPEELVAPWQCREIDESLLVDAVADAIGVPALEAAE